MKELIDHDPVTGVSTWFEAVESERKFRIHHTQDVEPILERNKRLQIEGDYKRAGIRDGMQHVAHIPDVTIIEWRGEGIDVFNPDHLPAVLRKLRDPQWRHLRTTLGAI